jgi:hypothetical protein
MNVGVELQRYPQEIIRKVMLVGKKKENDRIE